MDTVKRIVKSQLFKDFLKVLVAFLSGYASSGCGIVGGPAPNAAQLDVYKCQVEALAEAVPPAVAEDLVMALRAEQYTYAVRQLLALGLDRDRISALAKAYDACSPKAPPPEPVLDAS